MQWIFWAIFVSCMLHVIEECVFGFLTWARRAFPRLARGITARWAGIINAIFLLLALLAAALPGLPLALRLAIAALIALNGLLHVLATIRLRRYSPGLVTGLILYLPLGVLAYVIAARTNTLTAEAAVVSVLLALALHAVPLLSALVLARRASPGAGG
jgi:hypothetical protein